jgi:hypothetical protein
VTTTKDYGMKVHESALDAVKENVAREIVALAKTALSPENAAMVAGDEQALIAGDADKASEIESYKLAVYDAALTAYDSGAYKQGMGVLFGFIALIAVGVGLLIYL